LSSVFGASLESGPVEEPDDGRVMQHAVVRKPE
jgi:hypothetical protein